MSFYAPSPPRSADHSWAGASSSVMARSRPAQLFVRAPDQKHTVIVFMIDAIIGEHCCPHLWPQRKRRQAIEFQGGELTGLEPAHQIGIALGAGGKRLAHIEYVN